MHIFNISFSHQILGQIRVMSAAYDKTPMKLPLIWQPTPDYFNLRNNGSTYRLNNIDERTPGALILEHVSEIMADTCNVSTSRKK